VRRARELLGIVAAVGLGACYPKAGPAPGPLTPASLAAAQSRWPSTTAASLESGRKVFLDHCNKCHDYPDVTAFSEDKLGSVVPKMGKKAHLTQEETDQVLTFVLVLRQGS
jgi:hypothetical protein